MHAEEKCAHLYLSCFSYPPPSHRQRKKQKRDAAWSKWPEEVKMQIADKVVKDGLSANALKVCCSFLLYFVYCAPPKVVVEG